MIKKESQGDVMRSIGTSVLAQNSYQLTNSKKYLIRAAKI